MTESHQGMAEGVGMSFHIAEPKVADAGPIGPMHLQSWIETYTNPELGIDEDWIRNAVGHVASDAGTEFRRQLFERLEKNDKNTFYRVAKDDDGQVVGFAMARRGLEPDEPNTLDALYTLKRVQGKGLGSKLMERMLDWLGDDRPTRLEAVSYNQHAIGFYEHYGFVLTGKKRLYKDPIEAVEMIKV
jgi:GNAT superfamily N-acetyltransferase